MAIPIANAGGNQTVTEPETVQLDGSGSVDPDMIGITGYLWQQTNGPTITISDDSIVNPTFDVTATEVGEIRLILRVFSAGGTSSPDAVIIVVEDAVIKPIADAGPNQTVDISTLVTLDASGSTSPGGDPIITWLWVQTEGTTVTLSPDDSSEIVTYTSSATSEDNRFVLVVGTASADSDPDPIVVIVNETPVADAGSNQTVDLGDIVTLDGSASTGQAPLSFLWTQSHGTAVSLLPDNVSEVVTFEAIETAEDNRFTLVVNDGVENSDPDPIIVIVQDPALNPTADTGRNQTVDVDATVQLDGSESFDPRDLELTYNWIQTIGETVTLLPDEFSEQPTFVAPSTAQDLRFLLEVTNSDGQVSDPDPTIIVVEEEVILPIADAGIDQTVIAGALVTLDASGSTTPFAGPITYLWAQTYGDTIALSSTTAISPTFTAPAAGVTVQYSLIVTDTSNATVSIADHININANATGIPPIKPAPVGHYDSASITDYSSNAENPLSMTKEQVDGRLIRTAWANINPADNVYNWALIDNYVDLAQQQGKLVNIGIMDSYSAPAWVIASSDTFDYDFRGVTRTVALPWDVNYLAAKLKFITAFGVRYNNTLNVSSVYWTYAAMTNGIEGHWRVDEADYIASGYTPELLLQAGKDILDMYTDAFPNTKVMIEAHTVFDSMYQIEGVYNHGFDAVGNQVGIAIWWAASRIALNYGGGEIDSLAWSLARDCISNGGHVTCQFVGNFTDQMYRFDSGNNWSQSYGFQHEYLFFDSYGVKHFEIWTKDIAKDNQVIIDLLLGDITGALPLDLPGIQIPEQFAGIPSLPLEIADTLTFKTIPATVLPTIVNPELIGVLNAPVVTNPQSLPITQLPAEVNSEAVGLLNAPVITDAQTIPATALPTASTAQSIPATALPSALTAVSLPSSNPPFALNHARILYDNLLLGSSVSTNAGANGAFTLIPNTADRWTVTDGGAITYELDSAVDIDTVALGAHNLGTVGHAVGVEYSIDLVSAFVAFKVGQNPADDTALMFHNSSTVSVRRLKVTVSGLGDAFVGSIYAGVALQMQRPFFAGHTPINLSAVTTRFSSMSEGGNFIGETIRRKGFKTSADWSNLENDWYRFYFQPFVVSARTLPYYFAWNLDQYSLDVGYCKTSEDIAPSYGVKTRLDVSFSMVGFG